MAQHIASGCKCDSCEFDFHSKIWIILISSLSLHHSSHHQSVLNGIMMTFLLYKFKLFYLEQPLPYLPAIIIYKTYFTSIIIQIIIKIQNISQSIVQSHNFRVWYRCFILWIFYKNLYFFNIKLNTKYGFECVCINLSRCKMSYL